MTKNRRCVLEANGYRYGRGRDGLAWLSPHGGLTSDKFEAKVFDTAAEADQARKVFFENCQRDYDESRKVALMGLVDRSLCFPVDKLKIAWMV